MSHVFISYNHDDGDFAELLQSRIERVGFNTWMDEGQLRAGQNWRVEIDRAIREAFALIVVMTPRAKTSEYVTYEWAFAWGVGVEVIPLVFEETQLHPRLEALHYLDFTNRSARRWDRLMEALRKAEGTYEPRSVRVSRDTPPVVRKALDALDSMDSEAREAAIESLSQMDHPAAREALVQALQHEVRDVREQATHKLAELGDIRALSSLERFLATEWDSSMRDSMETLAKALGKEALPELLSLLEHEGEDVRTSAAWAIGQIRDASAAPHLLRLLNQIEEGPTKVAIVFALGRTADTSAIPYLIDILRTKGRRDRKIRAAALLEDLGPEAVYALAEVSSDEDSDVRLYATRALANIRDVAAVPALLDTLQHEESDVRSAALSALRAIGDVSAVPGLIDVLSYEDDNMQRSAASILERIGTPEALSAVEKWKKSQKESDT